MSLILGKEYCRIDNNGRFKFPIALKRQLPSSEDGRFVIRQSIYAECLELWTYASFQEEVEFLQKNLNPYNIEDRKLLRKLTDGNIIELKEDEDAMDTFNLARMDADDDRHHNFAEDADFQDSGFDIEDAPEDAGADIDADFDDE